MALRLEKYGISLSPINSIFLSLIGLSNPFLLRLTTFLRFVYYNLYWFYYLTNTFYYLVRESWRELAKIREGWRRLEKVGPLDKVAERFEKVGEGWRRLEKVG